MIKTFGGILFGLMAGVANAQLIYDFVDASTSDVLATLELAKLPASHEDIASLSFTKAGTTAFGHAGFYDGTFDTSNGTVVADSIGGLGGNTRVTDNDSPLPDFDVPLLSAGLDLIFKDSQAQDIITSRFRTASTLGGANRAGTWIPVPTRIGGWIDLDGSIVVRPVGNNNLRAELQSVEIASAGGFLVPVPSEATLAPFDSLGANAEANVGFTSDGGTAVDAEGLKLPVVYDLEKALEAGTNVCEDLADKWILTSGRTYEATDSELGNMFCTIPGDANFDGKVSFPDFLAVSQHFGTSTAVWTQGDFDWNRRVDFVDFILLSGFFGRTIEDTATGTPDVIFREAEAASVPEPASGPLFLLFGAIGLMRVRQHQARTQRS